MKTVDLLALEQLHQLHDLKQACTSFLIFTHAARMHRSAGHLP